MSIDIPTMLVAVLVAYALLVLDLAVVHRSLLSRQPELRLWTAGSLILLLAFLSIALRPLLAQAPAIFITNALMTFGCLIYAEATHRFVRGTALPRWHVASWPGWCCWRGRWRCGCRTPSSRRVPACGWPGT